MSYEADYNDSFNDVKDSSDYFYDHIKNLIPDALLYTQNLTKESELNLIYFYDYRTFHVGENHRQRFLSAEVFSFFNIKEANHIKFLKALELLSRIMNKNIHFLINEKDNFDFFFSVGSFSDQEKSYDITVDFDGLSCDEFKNFNYQYENVLMRDIKEQVKKVLGIDISDIEDLTSEQIALLTMLSM